MPEDVAAHLVDSGVDPALPTSVYERLTHDDEAVTETTLGALAREAGEGANASDRSHFSDLSVVVVEAPEATATSVPQSEGKHD